MEETWIEKNIRLNIIAEKVLEKSRKKINETREEHEMKKEKLKK